MPVRAVYEAHTPIEWGIINSPKKSAGHLIFRDGFEYFAVNRNVYRGDRKDPVECTGTRNGRFYSTLCYWMQSPLAGDPVTLPAIQGPAPCPQYERGDL